METIIRSILADEHIEYAGFLPFSSCRVIRPELLARSCPDFIPQSAILLAAPYYTGEWPERTVSLYAVPRDYHLFFRLLYEAVIPKLEKAYPGSRFRGFADHSPIGEVGAAAKAGLGMIGDKGQLIHPVYGSYFFIGEILTDAAFASYDEVEIRFCEHCGACGRACPRPGGGCLSEETQRKGVLSPDTERDIRSTGIAWGCDLCRTSCPHNRNVKKTPIPFFKENLTPVVTADQVAGLTKEAFSERAYSWRGRNVILRNLRVLESNRNDGGEEWQEPPKTTIS